MPLAAETRWVLLRAFGPPRARFDSVLDGGSAAGLARDLQLTERLVARVPTELLAAEIGRELVRELALGRLEAQSRTRHLIDRIPEIAASLTGAGIPLALLKGAALHCGHYLAEGSRSMADLDLLVAGGDAAQAVGVLRRLGFQAAPATVADHHLPPLHDREGRVVEMHTRVLGIRTPGGRRFATLEDLQAHGVLEPAPGLPDGCSLPCRELLAAHLVAHGLAHHGGSDDYPVTRTLADLVDVLPERRLERGLDAHPWIAEDVPRSELATVLALCDALEGGRLDLLDDASTSEGALLRHVLAGALDPGYRSSLVVRKVLDPVTDQPRWRRVARTLRWALLPSDAELAARLGAPDARVIDGRLRRARWARLARRLPELLRAGARNLRRRLDRSGGEAP